MDIGNVYLLSSFDFEKKFEVKCEVYSFMKCEVKCEVYSFMKCEVNC